MATEFLESGRDDCAVLNFVRHTRRLHEGKPLPDLCTFALPKGTLVSLGDSVLHQLRYDNGTVVPIAVTTVTGGIDGVLVTARLP
jgi:hypothetical protein